MILLQDVFYRVNYVYVEVSRTRKYHLSGYFLGVIKHTGLVELDGGAKGAHAPLFFGEKVSKSI